MIFRKSLLAALCAASLGAVSLPMTASAETTSADTRMNDAALILTMRRGAATAEPSVTRGIHDVRRWRLEHSTEQWQVN